MLALNVLVCHDHSVCTLLVPAQCMQILCVDDFVTNLDHINNKWNGAHANFVTVRKISLLLTVVWAELQTVRVSCISLAKMWIFEFV